MPILSTVWSLLSSYRPNAATDRSKSRRFGAFVPTYYPPTLWRAPKNDREAQRLYNHIRTVAFYLDAAPVLADMGLPFRAGLDDIISLVPLYGDIAAGVLQLYQVWLAFVFGIPIAACVQMFFNVILDVLVGIVPIIGDILDNLFKSNLRNLAVLEAWLLSSQACPSQYHILLMPDSTVFLPEPKLKTGAGSTSFGASRWSAWFGIGNATATSEAADELERERVTGSVRKTRRMSHDEAMYAFGSGVHAAAMQAEAEGEARASATARPNPTPDRRANGGAQVGAEPVD